MCDSGEVTLTGSWMKWVLLLNSSRGRRLSQDLSDSRSFKVGNIKKINELSFEVQQMLMTVDTQPSF